MTKPTEPTEPTITITRKVWIRRLFLFTIYTFFSIFQVNTTVSWIFLVALMINMGVYNPWCLAKLQNEEDMQLKK